MPTSCVFDGKVLDFHYKKLGHTGNTYNFYIGDIYIGQIFRMKRGEYSIVSKHPHPLSPINGLRSRYHASELLLKMAGYWE